MGRQFPMVGALLAAVSSYGNEGRFIAQRRVLVEVHTVHPANEGRILGKESLGLVGSWLVGRYSLLRTVE